MAIMKEGEALIRQGDTGLWYCFKEPVVRFSCNSAEELSGLMEYLDRRVEGEGLYAAGYLTYEAAPAFDPALTVSGGLEGPVAEFALYNPPELQRSPDLSVTAEGLEWTPLISQEEYEAGFRHVKEHLRRGESYQVNYTYRLQAPVPEDSLALFNCIQRAQSAGYGAYLDFPDRTVCSASPELFFSKKGRHIFTRPMKGTAPRGMTTLEDREQAAALRASEKDRAENMMIVDMIRNDLGKIARTGTVRVPELFTLEKYPTLWQMTSSVSAETEASVPEILKALYPCASITGAPKCRTMEIIRDLEKGPRGIYTGSIGYWGPEGEAQFNVAIRTVAVDKKRALYGTGGGVVWDSSSSGEYQETLTKTSVLFRQTPEFSLLETMLWTRDEGIFLMNRHLERLALSAEYFDRPCDRDLMKRSLEEHSESLKESSSGESRKIRLLLDSKGRISLESGEAAPLLKPLVLGMADSPVDRRSPFVYHKTTHRGFYQKFRDSCPGTDDVLLWNERGELTESTIANLVLVLDGSSYTPPVSCGLLGGTLRKELLERGELEERVLFREDLYAAEEVYLINSVRGRLAVRLADHF
ncbi:MAG: aminodeoxychorismate synthase component I [Spirochaetales bacterium]|nr:aminodeoxychorismate synthase component I [Spirochaetales bacterium]